MASSCLAMGCSSSSPSSSSQKDGGPSSSSDSTSQGGGSSSASARACHEYTAFSFPDELATLPGLASDEGHVYAVGSTPGGDYELVSFDKKTHQGTAIKSFTNAAGAFLGMGPPVSADSRGGINYLAADTLDGFLYFEGDKDIWAVKKDGTADVARISSADLSTDIQSHCGFSPNILTPTDLLVCRGQRLLKIPRGGGTPVAVHTGSLTVFTANGTTAFVDADQVGDAEPGLISINLSSGAETPFPALPPSFSPAAALIDGDALILADGVSGTYRVGTDGSGLKEIATFAADFVGGGVAAGGASVYAYWSDTQIRRIPVDGSGPSTFVDCTKVEEVLVGIAVDATTVYVINRGGGLRGYAR